MGALKKIGFFTAFIIPLLVIAGYYLDGPGNFLAVIFAFLIIPIVDQWSGLDSTNIPDDKEKIISEDQYYRFVTYVWATVQVMFLLWGCWVVTTGKINSMLEWIGFILSTSLVTGGIGITVAHELGHKNLHWNASSAKHY